MGQAIKAPPVANGLGTCLVGLWRDFAGTYCSSHLFREVSMSSIYWRIYVSGVW